jgi:hypothetical protein
MSVSRGAARISFEIHAALHADPYFPDEPVTLSVGKGRGRVLQGFVCGDWDLEQATYRREGCGQQTRGRQSVDQGGSSREAAPSRRPVHIFIAIFESAGAIFAAVPFPPDT